MIIDVVLVFIVSALLIIGWFFAKSAPLLRSERERERLPRRRSGMYLLEERLHETESPDAISRPAPFAGAHATLAAARDHFAVADAYKDDWHRRFPDEPAARPDQREAEVKATMATLERPTAEPERREATTAGTVTPPEATQAPVAAPQPEPAAAVAEPTAPPLVEPVAEILVIEEVPEPLVIIEEDVYEAVILPPLPEEGAEEERPGQAA